KATERKIPDALKAAEQLVDLGVAEDAAKASQQAGKGIEEMREGVERSAKSVLGDETAALRRAQGEIEDLADQVGREIAQATGRERPTQQGRIAQNDQNGQRTQDEDPRQEGQQTVDPFDGVEMHGGQPRDQVQDKQQVQDGAGQRNRQRQQ